MIESELSLPSEGACSICWRDEEHGILVPAETPGVECVHPCCLDFFGVDTVEAFERSYFDP